METLAIYTIDGIEYELYLAASGDYCVSVSKYGKERFDYNIGKKDDAFAFILSNFKIDDDNIDRI